MKSKGHFYFSLAKSIVRIVACITSILWLLLNNETSAIFMLASGMGVAELLGISEEIFDERG